LYNTKKEELVLESYASNIAFGNESNFTEKIIQKIERHQPSTSHTDSSYHQNDIRLEPIEFTQYKKLLQDLSSFDSIVTPQIKCFLHKDINDRFGLVHYQNKYYRITPNSYLNSLSYNIQKNINKEIVGENFINYAKYNHDTLVMQTGQYPFNYIFNYTLNQDQTILESPDTKNFSNTVFFFDPNLKVVMSSYSTKPISPITLFSYIICFNLIAYLIFSILVNVSENLIYRKKVKIGSLSLRNRINYFIIAVIILIFTVVAVMSFSYLKSKSEEDKKEYIINKMNAVQKFLQLHRSNSETDSHISMDHLVKQLSLSNNVPVILYHFGSEFNKTTFDEKQSPKNEVDIDPMTFWMLAQKNKRSLETYYLNQKKYIEASTMLDPFDSSVHCILSIPLSSDNRVLNNDTTSFIVALVNLYVFLFIIALILSFSLSNNITSPLKTLSQKISKINIQQKNDHIEYHIDDEIGDLVKRYNSMVDEIEESAKLMANNEREDAWREMAKQIAHEIKSPLTPMKLSIQHLQRMVTEQRENSVELTKRVCETVIEQIDNLSEIATSFSNFAKINNPKLEKVDVVPILRNISDLFNNEETNSKVRFSSAVEEAAIYCDTNQLISCINNLIKNGLQAAADRDVALVDVRIFSIDNSFRISIKDNGMGVPIEIQHKIFKPNFTTKNSGTGLGLAITKKFVEAMNGTIEFNTIENVGTEFILTFAKV
jgi:nitrogen fixation/metabolism regulation signal transduction histidine kinase